ncbi:hypothetical protein FSOLCH5_000469 [Fusarium solani]|uniref:Uncharacterized protein n=1 Tax=Fusarium solani TaxID=169388 RepID=A0A9P9RDC0_FUSSL|nr:uncharacterized protein B0J15DRAFT_480399 [Fusarium solani]KAH7274659.1 hypothetical protein B0J15DRAFT_480399 [Fusarium solani]KAJ3470392.1 hypothetical protein MRS44_000491 [Fusarium solani]KAJ4224198.1 hypothetical protein NW759_005861 [Fusarium solani]
MIASHGRGGAGNMADTAHTPKTNPADLQTPVLRGSVVTTGRGGTGNMAKNDDPRETRKRQDVEAVPRRPSAGAQHSGRGGAGNVFKDTEEELTRRPSNEEAIAEEDEPAKPAPATESLAQKGKNWLFGKKA